MEVSVGQVNVMGTLPCSVRNVLEPMLHPGHGIVNSNNTGIHE